MVAPRSLHADGNGCGVIQVFNGQARQAVVEFSAGLVVAIAICEEHTAVHHLCESRHFALLQGSLAMLPALFSGLMHGRPIRIGIAVMRFDTLKTYHAG